MFSFPLKIFRDVRGLAPQLGIVLVLGLRKSKLSFVTRNLVQSKCNNNSSNFFPKSPVAIKSFFNAVARRVSDCDDNPFCPHFIRVSCSILYVAYFINALLQPISFAKRIHGSSNSCRSSVSSHSVVFTIALSVCIKSFG